MACAKVNVDCNAMTPTELVCTILALASQSLSIMISLVPYVRETFRRHLSPREAVMLVEFDKLKRVGEFRFDYQEMV